MFLAVSRILPAMLYLVIAGLLAIALPSIHVPALHFATVAKTVVHRTRGWPTWVRSRHAAKFLFFSNADFAFSSSTE